MPKEPFLSLEKIPFEEEAAVFLGCGFFFEFLFIIKPAFR